MAAPQRWKSRPKPRPFVIPDVDGHARVPPANGAARAGLLPDDRARSWEDRVDDALVRAGYFPADQALAEREWYAQSLPYEVHSEQESHEPYHMGSLPPPSAVSSARLTEYEEHLALAQRWRQYEDARAKGLPQEPWEGEVPIPLMEPTARPRYTAGAPTAHPPHPLGPSAAYHPNGGPPAGQVAGGQYLPRFGGGYAPADVAVVKRSRLPS